MKHPTFEACVQHAIATKEASGHLGTACAYSKALRRFLEFGAGAEHPLTAITPTLIARFEAWLKGRGVIPNTISFYMRPLRAVYNAAVRRGLVREAHPFADAYTGVATTKKRAISHTQMKKIQTVDLTDEPQLAFYRDMFMLSFYLMGISFVDLAHLRKTDVRQGRIIYRRAKTGQEISVCVTLLTSNVLDRYPAPPGSPYLLPIIWQPGTDEDRQYQTALRTANRALKAIAARAGVAECVTTYTTRHSWATLAQQRHVAVPTISFALGHESEATTRIYLAGVDTTRIDKANARVLRGF